MLQDSEIHDLMATSPEAYMLGDELLRIKKLCGLFARRARQARAMLVKTCTAIDLVMDV